MATSIDNVVSMIATSDRHHAVQVSVWQERASKLVVIALAAILLVPVMLTFTVLALFVARMFGVPITSSALPDREPHIAGR